MCIWLILHHAETTNMPNRFAVSPKCSLEKQPICHRFAVSPKCQSQLWFRTGQNWTCMRLHLHFHMRSYARSYASYEGWSYETLVSWPQAWLLCRVWGSSSLREESCKHPLWLPLQFEPRGVGGGSGNQFAMSTSLRLRGALYLGPKKNLGSV